MNEDQKSGTAMAEIIEAARAVRKAKVIVLNEGADGPIVPMVAVPQAGGGVELESVLGELKAFEEWKRERPDRRAGTAKLDDLDSFVAHARRFMDADSAIWISGDPKTPKFTSVLDYHEAVNPPDADLGPLLPAKEGDIPVTVEKTAPRTALPRFGKHRGEFVPTFSEEWKLWTGKDGKALSQADFAKLIELGARDIVDVEDVKDGPTAPLEFARWFHARFGGKTEIVDFFASTGDLLEMSERLVIRIEEKVGEVSSRSGGSRAVIFEGETKSEVVIPTALLLQLSIFRGGDQVQIPARLRVKPRQQSNGTRTLEFTVDLYGVDLSIAKDLSDMGEEVKARTGLPVFMGTPEP